MAHLYDETDRKIHKRACELLGGEAEYQKIADEEHHEVMKIWNQNTELIGRILRAHLFVEKFMVMHLRHLRSSRAQSTQGFAKKIEHLDRGDPEVVAVIPGIRKLNEIRNRLAHEINATLTAEDVGEFFQCRNFYHLMLYRHQRKIGALQPIEVLEDFSRFAAITLSLNRSRLVAAVRQATEEMGTMDGR